MPTYLVALCARSQGASMPSAAQTSDYDACVQGFRKMASSSQEFCHPNFRRGHPELLSQMYRGGLAAAAGEGPQVEMAALKTQARRCTRICTVCARVSTWRQCAT
jgi:hypothetical protein